MNIKVKERINGDLYNIEAMICDIYYKGYADALENDLGKERKWTELLKVAYDNGFNAGYEKGRDEFIMKVKRILMGEEDSND